MLIYFVVAGTTSAVNLTDGLDGLAAGCAAIVLLAYIAITFTTRQIDLALVAGCLVGACVGFLWFNSFPASIFMGDTGSLGLGGAIAAMAVMTKTEVLLIILGGIFVIEALSVLIQVFSFQTFRKRVFLMAPIHHHFELQAWSETKIILRFWIVASVCSAIGFTLYQQSLTAEGGAGLPIAACDAADARPRRQARPFDGGGRVPSMVRVRATGGGAWIPLRPASGRCDDWPRNRLLGPCARRRWTCRFVPTSTDHRALPDPSRRLASAPTPDRGGQWTPPMAEIVSAIPPGAG